MTANNYIHNATDYLQMIKMKKEFMILKHLMLNNIQQKCFQFIKNINFNQDGFVNIDKDLPEIMDVNMDLKEVLELLKKYFETKIKLKTITDIDKKILNIIDPKVKEIFDQLEN